MTFRNALRSTKLKSLLTLLILFVWGFLVLKAVGWQTAAIDPDVPELFRQRSCPAAICDIRDFSYLIPFETDINACDCTPYFVVGLFYLILTLPSLIFYFIYSFIQYLKKKKDQGQSVTG